MFKEFTNYIKSKSLFSDNTKILAAVSGGADSMVLLNLLTKGNYKIAVAHCNFNLRGEESEEDEIFVMKTCEKLDVTCHTANFDTQEFARKMKLSIEEAARNLRYEWFEKIRQEYGYDVIATAHHGTDRIETFFINLAKGTGIRGLSGIKPQRGNIVRPLLFADRNSIEKWAESNSIQYRTDCTNFETKYIRNKIRHQITPVFESINPRFGETMSENIERLQFTETLFNFAIEHFRKHFVSTTNEETVIDIEKLLSSPAPAGILFELLHPFGFSGTVAQQLYDSLHMQSGPIFYSESHKALKDREFIFVRKTQNTQIEETLIPKPNDGTAVFDNLQFEIFERDSAFHIDPSTNIAQLDAEKITFPLTVRTMREGDFFYPLGMKGKKMLSDFFIDKKINNFEKNRIRLITGEKQIVWVCGMRIDERFKITDSTKYILKITKIR